MYSKTVIVGNLARDPESRQAGETTVTRLVVAVNGFQSQSFESRFVIVVVVVVVLVVEKRNALLHDLDVLFHGRR